MARTDHSPIPEPAFTPVRLVFLVFLPFASGYFLSYYFRTVNAVLAGRLMADLGLDAAQLGVITAAYFLIAAAAQLPLGFVLDRFGPRSVQAGCLLLAGIGAFMFANAQHLVSLFVARGLIGLGVASALLAGLKALAMSCPPQRLGLFNGIFMSLGATGAIAASLPTETLLNWIDWRQLFVALAVATFASAGLIWSFVPKGLSASPSKGAAVPGYLEIIRDRGFWQLAPLSALAVGGAWALQGLWGAPWLRDVARLDQQAIALHLVVMAGALCVAALVFGVAINALGKRGIGPVGIMSVASLVFIVAEVGLALEAPISPLILWSLIAAFGAGTVLSYTINARRFPKECLGRANSALNLFHFAAAFAVQSLVGQVVALWPRDDLGHYPAEAYKAALLGLAASQLLALIWFMQPIHRRVSGPAVQRTFSRGPTRRWARLRIAVPLSLLVAVLATVGYSNRNRLGASGLTALGSGFWEHSSTKRFADHLRDDRISNSSRAPARWSRQSGQQPRGRPLETGHDRQ